MPQPKPIARRAASWFTRPQLQNPRLSATEQKVAPKRTGDQSSSLRNHIGDGRPPGAMSAWEGDTLTSLSATAGCVLDQIETAQNDARGASSTIAIVQSYHMKAGVTTTAPMPPSAVPTDWPTSSPATRGASSVLSPTPPDPNEHPAPHQ